jgi:hypothetical protein
MERKTEGVKTKTNECQYFAVYHIFNLSLPDLLDEKFLIKYFGLCD